MQPQPVIEYYDDYEYDGYYNTRVNSAWTEKSLPKLIGVLLIFMGILSIVWTAVDIGSGALKNPALNNPNYRNRSNLPLFEDPNLAATWHENSIWPTSGKGIWVGLLVSNKDLQC